jgi:cellulose synthase/poly-beta-1,6-N-acetylglucosamine synthase-like glycosyltransferase
MAVEVVFWILAMAIVYVYAGYPLLLLLTVGRQDRSFVAQAADGDLPRVTLLISAFNEADCIAEKLDNTLLLDWPSQLLEVIVISDASDDATDEIVEQYSGRGVRLLRMPNRGGKTVGLNAGVAASAGEFVVFSDANALYRADALRQLAQPFADARVGAVIGESTYVDSESESDRSESLYWRYETWIKLLESRGGSVVGGDGAIYAVRRALYQPMAADALSDFVNPLQVVRAGFACIYQPKAVSYESAASDFHREYRRKVRIVNRAWRALWSMRDMLNPFKYGVFALRLWSHKVLRWWVPVALVAVFIANVMLVDKHWVYGLTLGVQLAFYTLALGGFLLRRKRRQPFMLRIPFYFCLVNYASGIGLMEAMIGKSYTTWTTARAQG